MSDTVLIVAEEGDAAAEDVAAVLNYWDVRTFMFDTADFPQRAELVAQFTPDETTEWSGRIGSVARSVAFKDITSVYYRKPRDFDFPVSMSAPERRFSKAQARVGLGGVLSSLAVTWINHPSAVADAEYKPRQLTVAARCGLVVPPTLITNNAAYVREFSTKNAPLVVKPLAAPIVHEGGGYSAVYTRLVGDADLADLTGVEVTAHLFQKYVEKAHEVRLTAIDDQLFPIAIHAGSASSRVDWRTDYNSLTYEPVSCPNSVREGINRYLQAQGLVYGAFDFIVRPDDTWIFLECNAAGQWGWLAEECNLPIATAIAEALVKGHRNGDN